MQMRMQQGSGFRDFRFWDGVTERREKVKRGGADHVPGTLGGKEGLSWFFIFLFYQFIYFFSLSIGPNNKRVFRLSSSPLDPIFIFRYFRHLFTHFLAFFLIYSKPTKQNKIK